MTCEVCVYVFLVFRPLPWRDIIGQTVFGADVHAKAAALSCHCQRWLRIISSFNIYYLSKDQRRYNQRQFSTASSITVLIVSEECQLSRHSQLVPLIVNDATKLYASPSP